MPSESKSGTKYWETVAVMVQFDWGISHNGLTYNGKDLNSVSITLGNPLGIIVEVGSSGLSS